MSMFNNSTLVRSALIVGALLSSFSVCGREVEGVKIAESASVAGTPLILNGAGYRTRLFFKTAVEALYLVEPRQSESAIQKLQGPKRLELHVLRELSGAKIAKHFVRDFEAATDESEFKRLIKEVSQAGALYGTLTRVSPGDVIAIDWIPEKGILILFNGRPLTQSKGHNPYIDTPNAEFMYSVLLRMRLGSNAPDELRFNLLGLSRSMSQEKH